MHLMHWCVWLDMLLGKAVAWILLKSTINFRPTDDNFSEAHSANFGEPNNGEFKLLNAIVSHLKFSVIFLKTSVNYYFRFKRCETENNGNVKSYSSSAEHKLKQL